MSDEAEGYGQLDDCGNVQVLTLPELSEWTCHLFGGNASNGIAYTPLKGAVPNFMVRFFMEICLGCTWVRLKGEKDE